MFVGMLLWQIFFLPKNCQIYIFFLDEGGYFFELKTFQWATTTVSLEMPVCVDWASKRGVNLTKKCRLESKSVVGFIKKFSL